MLRFYFFKPLFFLAENVSGMRLERHHEALEEIKRQFKAAGYELSFTLVNFINFS
ncbi:MAG: DNA cytosine methyltransferase, partial [Erysipelotrichaceae bacterium]|nr:DNA cytosine methyltransferase [Erysipelotrichaceae bacterium]